MQVSEVCLSGLLKVAVVDARAASSSLTGFFRRCGLLSALIAASLLAGAAVQADAVTNAAETIQEQLSPMLDSLTQASVSVVQQDRATASTQIGLTLSLASGLLSTVQSPEMVATLGKTGKAIGKGISRFQGRLVKAKMLVDNPTVTDTAASKAMLSAVSDGQRLRKLLLAVPASDTVVALGEVSSSAIALHYSGDVVCFHVDVLDGNNNPSCGSADVSVTNLGGDPTDLVVIGSPSILSPTDFCLNLGPDAGTLRVTVSMCGQSSGILLYNYGVPKKKGPALTSPQSLAVETNTPDTIQLAWSYSATGADGFEVERSETGGDPWTQVGLTGNTTTASVASAIKASAAYAYVDSGLKASTTYYYRARAYNAKGRSGYSNTTSGSTASNTDTTPPSTPSGLNATLVSTTRIDVAWNSAVDTGGSGMHDYRVYRNGVLIATTSSTSYSSVSLTPATEYCFTVGARDNAGNASAQSGPLCTVTLSVPPPTGVDTTAPTVPDGVIVSADSATQITMQWNASSDSGGSGLAGYRVYRNGTLVTATAATGYSDSGLAPDAQCCYTVVAFDGAGNSSSASAQVCATTPTSPSTAPAAPSNLTVTVVTTTSITLNWQDNSDDELGFQIERATSANGPWSVAGTTGADVTSYIDIGLAPSSTYYYRVSAFN